MKKLKIKVSKDNQVVLEREFDSFPITFGRSSKVHISLPDNEFLSRHHLSILKSDDGKWLIEDNNSSNGIFDLQSKRIQKLVFDKTASIKIGDLILTAEDISPALEETKTLPPPQQQPPTTPVAASQPKKLKVDIPPSLPKFENAKPDLSILEHGAKKKKQYPKASIPQMPSQNVGAPLTTHLPESKPPPRYHTDASNQPRVYPSAIVDGKKISLEAAVYWRGVLYDIHDYFKGDVVTIGRSFDASLHLPTLNTDATIGFFDGKSGKVLVLKNQECLLVREGAQFTHQELMVQNLFTKKNDGLILRIKPGDEFILKMAEDIEVRFRFIPEPKRFGIRPMIEPDEELRRTILISGILHLFLAMIAIFNKPISHPPRIKDVPERFARLLVEPPRQLIEVKKPEPPPPPPPEKKPEPPKVKPKEVPKKPIVQRKPKQVIVREQKIMKQVNQFPVNVKQTAPSTNPTKAPPVKVESIGALGALGAISSAPSTQPVAVNINKNAGGAPSLNTGGVIGTIKTNNGQLVAGGSGSLKTKGLGYGSGKGYGVDGIKGTAGSRAVGGTVGAPQLLQLATTEGLTQKQVMDVVRQHMAEIQQCYERSLLQNPDLKGRIEYEWEITPKGKVTQVGVKKSEMNGADSLNSCVTNIFRKMQFPQAKNGESTHPNIGFPFGRM